MVELHFLDSKNVEDKKFVMHAMTVFIRTSLPVKGRI